MTSTAAPTVAPPTAAAVPAVHQIEPAWVSTVHHGADSSKSWFQAEHGVAEPEGGVIFGGACYGKLQPIAGKPALHCGGNGQPSVFSYAADGTLRWAWAAPKHGHDGRVHGIVRAGGSSSAIIITGSYASGWAPLGKRLTAPKHGGEFTVALDATTGAARWVLTSKSEAITADDAGHVYALRTSDSRWLIEQRSVVDGSLRHTASLPSCATCTTSTIGAIGRAGGGAVFVVQRPDEKQLGIVRIAGDGTLQSERSIALDHALDRYQRPQVLALDHDRMVVGMSPVYATTTLVVLGSDDTKVLETSYPEALHLVGHIGDKLLVFVSRYGMSESTRPLFGAQLPPPDQIEGGSAAAAIDLTTGRATDVWVPPFRNVVAIAGAAGRIIYSSRPGIVGLNVGAQNAAQH